MYKYILSMLTVALLFGFVGMTGCQTEEKTTGEKVGEAVDDAADAVGDALEDAADATGDALEDAADAVEDAAEDAADAAEEATEEVPPPPSNN